LVFARRDAVEQPRGQRHSRRGGARFRRAEDHARGAYSELPVRHSGASEDAPYTRHSGASEDAPYTRHNGASEDAPYTRHNGASEDAPYTRHSGASEDAPYTS